MSPTASLPAEVVEARNLLPSRSKTGGAGGPDLAGLAFVGALVGWVHVSAAVSGGNPWPETALVLGAGMVLLVARVIARRARSAVPLGVVLAVGALLAFRAGSVFGGSPPIGPLGYANASAALFVQGAIAGFLLQQTGKGRWTRALGMAAMAVFAILVIFGRSRAATYLLLVLPVIAVGLLRYRGPRVAVWACAALFLAALGTTLVLANSGSSAGGAAAVLDSRRILLWRESWVLGWTHPLTGVGPGRFAEASGVAHLDPDAAWAHHDFLQQGAETGIVGMVLLVAVFLWAYSRLWSARSGAASVLGAVSLTALGIHASVDYVLQFPAVVLVAAALTGAGMIGPGCKSGAEELEPSEGAAG